MKTLELTQKNFQTEVLEATGPAVVDFWAEWCGPCRALAPTLDKLAADLGGTAKVGKVDVDANPDLAAAFEVRSIPTLVFFQDGVEVGRQVGLSSFTELRDRVAELAADAA